jgi:hypothetical protein
MLQTYVPRFARFRNTRGLDDPRRRDRAGVRPPAVVGVEHATRLIHNGQRIRVYGTDGYVEILP